MEEHNHHEEPMPAAQAEQPQVPPDEVEALQTKCEEYLLGWKRAQADYQNLKKDSERERADFAKYANERLIHDLLPALEQYDLVLKHVPDVSQLPENERKQLENWLVGVRAVKAHWDQAANSIGLERITPDTIFNPAEHEAAGEESAPDQEPGSILKVVQGGWKLHNKVLRPAKVILVSLPPSPPLRGGDTGEV